MHFYFPKVVDLASWALVVLGCGAVLASVTGIASVLWTFSPSGRQHVERGLDESAYAVVLNWTSLIPFVLCLVLGAAIIVIGFLQTSRHTTSVVTVGARNHDNIESGSQEP